MTEADKSGIDAAKSDAERAVEAAIAEIPAWRGRDIAYRPVSGGISNTNWRIDVEGETGSFFLKMPGRGTEMFIDRKAAQAASRQAEAIGLGPRTYDYLAHRDIEIAEFIADRHPSTHRDFSDPSCAPRRLALTSASMRRHSCRSPRRSST